MPIIILFFCYNVLVLTRLQGNVESGGVGTMSPTPNFIFSEPKFFRLHTLFKRVQRHCCASSAVMLLLCRASKHRLELPIFAEKVTMDI